MTRRRILSVLTFLSILVTFLPNANAQATMDFAATLAGCANIMPLGDSITAGTYGGYRDNLFTGLQQDNCGVTFVGTQYDPNAEIPDKHHEGHPFFTINDIAANVDSWIAADQPDIIILMIGTNDIAWFSNENADQIGARHDALIGQIEKDTPDAWIFVASIPPETSAPIPPNNVDRATLVTQFNSVVQKNVAARESAGQHVRFVDVNAALTVDDISTDGIHPLQEGYSKIGQSILKSIEASLATPSATASPAAPASTPAPAPTPPASSTPTPPALATPVTTTSTTPPSSHGGALDGLLLLCLAAAAMRKLAISRR